MNLPPHHHSTRDAVVGLLGSAPFGKAITITIVATAYLAFVLKSTIQWPGLIAVVSALVVLAAGSLAVRRHELEWRGILPISLLVFLGWSAVSVFWTDYQWAALSSILYQFAFAFLGIYVALTRDLIQIVRAFGDVLRVILLTSLILEVMSGLLLDVPFVFLRISGNLAAGGPIQGVLGTRNQLGLVALIALVTFFVEWRTRSVHPQLATYSLVLGAVALWFTRSPVAFGITLVVAVAALALFGLRRLDPASRRLGQISLLSVLVVVGVIGLLARGQVVRILNAGSEFEYRYSLWQSISAINPDDSLEGFGWIGYWRTNLPPYSGIGGVSATNQSALNAFVDVWFQLGIVGLSAFVVFFALALGRSWVLASNKRSVVYLWPALIVVVLLSVSSAESTVLVEFGWFTLVVCALKASQDLSWRVRLPQD
jgi:exopolysaccharide production protein ExoQ